MRYRPMPDIPLAVGDALPFTVFDRYGQPLLVKGHLVENDLMLARLCDAELVPVLNYRSALGSLNVLWARDH